MLKKTLRLKKAVLKTSPLFSDRFFNLKASPNSLDSSRFAFIVSKKVDKRATARNRIKRVLRSCVEENIPKIKGGYDFLFVLKKDALSTPRQEICSSLVGVLNRGNFIK